jgi:hypothetical protein
MTIRDILEELRCINCDGSGGLQVSEDEVEQCQFCYEIRYPFIDQAETAINAYILGEVMELLKDDGLYEPKARAIKYPIPESAKYLQVPVVGIESFVYQELRNKANERWGK